MQPPQNPYEQQPPTQPPPPQQPQYPQQPQQPYGYPPQQGYGREYRPAGGRYGRPGAGAIDYIFGIVLLLISLVFIGYGVYMVTQAGNAASEAYRTLSTTQQGQLSVDTFKTVIMISAGFMIAWCLGLLFCAIGIMRFKKGAMIATGVMSLLAFLLLGAGLAINMSQGTAVSQGSALIISIVQVALTLVYTIYGFARAGAAN